MQQISWMAVLYTFYKLVEMRVVKFIRNMYVGRKFCLFLLNTKLKVIRGVTESCGTCHHKLTSAALYEQLFFLNLAVYFF